MRDVDDPELSFKEIHLYKVDKNEQYDILPKYTAASIE